jgi:hypothetical protein
VRKKLFDDFKKGLEHDFFCPCEDFGKSLWRFWKAMKEKLWE